MVSKINNEKYRECIKHFYFVLINTLLNSIKRQLYMIKRMVTCAAETRSLLKSPLVSLEMSLSIKSPAFLEFGLATKKRNIMSHINTKRTKTLSTTNTHPQINLYYQQIPSDKPLCLIHLYFLISV